MARKSGYNYFSTFIDMCTFAHKAAEHLNETLHNYKSYNILSRVEEIHEIEHSADDKRHELIRHLAKEFITPIEREDIMELIQKLDNVVDGIEDVVKYMYMFNITEVNGYSLEFSNLIVKCTASMKMAMENFSDFRKNQEIRQYILDVNTLEEDGDKMQVNALRDIFSGDTSPEDLIKWSKIIDCLEACLDACEEVVDTVERIIMKNS